MTTIDFLRAITEASGVSGYEDQVREIVKNEFSNYCDEVQIDPMGSVLGIKHGSSNCQRRIMLAGHMDEIGLMVKKLDKHVIRFTQVGGFDPRVLPGQPVAVHGKHTLNGVIGMRPPHVTPPEERNKVIDIDDLFIDVGLSEADLKDFVQVGDIITLRRDLVELKNDLVASKAMDDRAGVAAVYECLKALAGLQHDWEVYAVATVQEEVGLRGAMTSACGISPDAAIAIDVTFGHTPETTDVGTVELDKGPGIACGPNIHPVMYARLVDTAKKLEIPYQVEALPGRSGTDAWAIQVAQGGVPTGLLGIPLRYMHTPVETLCLRDVQRCGRLMAHFIAELAESVIGDFTPALPEEA